MIYSDFKVIQLDTIGTRAAMSFDCNRQQICLEEIKETMRIRYVLKRIEPTFSAAIACDKSLNE